MRQFLFKVWKQARTENSFENQNSRLFSEELAAEVSKAELEWQKIDKDLMQMVKTETSSGLLAAGPLIASGYANFLAAAAVVAGVINVASSTIERYKFPDRYPAAFFMKMDK